MDYVGIRLYGSSLISPIMDDITTCTIYGAEVWPMKHRNTDNVIWYTGTGLGVPKFKFYI